MTEEICNNRRFSNNRISTFGLWKMLLDWVFKCQPSLVSQSIYASSREALCQRSDVENGVRSHGLFPCQITVPKTVQKNSLTMVNDCNGKASNAGSVPYLLDLGYFRFERIYQLLLELAGQWPLESVLRASYTILGDSH